MGSKNKNKSKNKRRDDSDNNNNNKNRKIITDSRFASVHSDPRFQNVPKQKSKVAIDSRFDRMFTDKSFASSTAPSDKRGKPRKNLKTSKSSLQHYYRIEEEDKKGDEDKEIEEKEKRNETDSESELKEAADVSSGSGTEEDDDDDVSESTTDDDEEDVDFDEGPEEEVDFFIDTVESPNRLFLLKWFILITRKKLYQKLTRKLIGLLLLIWTGDMLR